MKRIIITSIFSVAIATLIAQSSDRNYVKTVTYLDSIGSGSVTDVQYYDGLGRPDVSVTGGANTSGKYLYSYQTYDGCGRADAVWSPVAGGTTPEYKSLSEIQSLSQNLYGDNYGYSTTTYDALDRPTFASTPGSAWVGKGKSTAYGTNAANEVKKYNAGSIPNFTYYPKNTLQCTQTMDEDGHIAKTYKDLFGNVVLERSIDGNTNFDTYYVYNSHNQLSYVLQPMFQEDDDLDKFSFKYTYDEYGRMKTKTIPGCDPVEYWYDDADRVDTIQDGILRDSLRYRVYEYDALGRMKKQSISDGKKTLYDEIINFYDTYDFIEDYCDLLPNDSDRFYPNDEDYGHANLTGTWQRASNGEELLTTFGYDNFGRVETESRLGLDKHLTFTVNSYDFIGNVVSQKVDEYDYNSETKCLELSNCCCIDNYYNSKNNNLLSYSLIDMTKMYKDNNTWNMSSLTDTIQCLTYDDFGHVIKNDRKGTKADMSYTYDNLHGWLTNVSASGGFTQWLFHEKGSANPCFNGSISAMIFQGAGLSLGYNYSYDGLNRLISAASVSVEGTVSGINDETMAMLVAANGSDDNVRNYGEIYVYDRNSNITDFKRYGYIAGTSHCGLIDDIEVDYNGNKRIKIDDCAGNQIYSKASDFIDGEDDNEIEYCYDKNGSLIEDSNKGLTFEYDLLGHPLAVHGEAGDIEYVYDPNGQKLRTVYTAKSKSSTTISTQKDYIGNMILLNGVPEMFRFPGGYISYLKGLPKYTCYYVQDYQGNNIMVYRDGLAPIQRTGYYPSGNFIGRLVTGGDTQGFKFGDKELDRTYGLDLYDFHARQYDAIVPAFTSIDPMAEKYYSISPYAYCAGDPVNCIDPTGMDTLNVTGHYDKNKHWIWDIDHHSGGDCDIYNVTDANGNKTTYTFHKDADISQLYIENTGDCWLSIINVKGESTYGFAVNPLGEDMLCGTNSRPYPGFFAINSNNDAGKWKCAGPKVMGFNNTQTNSCSDRQIRIHYAGYNVLSETETKAVGWTKGCSVVSTKYTRDLNGSIMFKPSQSYELYCNIQSKLGGTSISYVVTDSKGKTHTRYGYSFTDPINKWMEFK